MMVTEDKRETRAIKAMRAKWVPKVPRDKRV